jgi:AraC-like DNA-binding protein
VIDGLLEDGKNNRYCPEICADSTRLVLRLCSRPESDLKGSAAYETYQRARQQIELNYCKLSGIAEVARNVFCSQAYLSRLFKRYSDEPPHALLNRLRMNRAALLLLHHDLSIQEVSEYVGFSDPFHFSTRFKAFHGNSPRNFKKSGG